MAKKTTTPSLTQKKLQAMLAEAEQNLATLQQRINATPTVDTTRLSGIEKASEKPVVQNVEEIKPDPYYVRDPKTGLSPAQVDARKSLEALAGPDTKLVTPTGSAGQLIPKPPLSEDENFIYDYIWVGGSTGSNIGSWKQVKKAKPAKYSTGGSNQVTGSAVETGVVSGPSTNVDVLKSMLRGLGFNSAIIDSSTSFLMSLLKDGLDYDNAVAIFLNSKDYTLKDGKKVESPFYAEYSYLNEGLVRPKSASELYNAVEGYKEVAAKYNLNTKFTSKDYMKDYVKNNITVANLAERANLARLKSVNADPAYIDSLRQLGYITSAADLTDFFLDPKDCTKRSTEKYTLDNRKCNQTLRKGCLMVVDPTDTPVRFFADGGIVFDRMKRFILLGWILNISVNQQ